MSHLVRVRPFLRRTTGGITRHFDPPPQPLGSATNTMKAWIPNGSMKRGPKYFVGHWGTENGAYMWVLMPGVPKENVTVNVVGNQITFQGTEVLDVPDYPGSEDDLLRKYKGTLEVDPARFDAQNLKAEIVNGIFWLHLPNKYGH